MDKAKARRLARKGWKVGTAKEFLGLSDQEAAYVDVKLALSRNLGALRRKHHLTQVQLAKRLRSSQSRVAKMEAGDPSVSVDLLIRSLLALGATKEGLAKAIRATTS